MLLPAAAAAAPLFVFFSFWLLGFKVLGATHLYTRAWLAQPPRGPRV
jgi:hypothetical protein